MSKWIEKLSFEIPGNSVYFPNNIVNRQPQLKVDKNTEIGIYRSKDFPHVFLGAGFDTTDIRKAEEMAGAKVCARIDVTSAEAPDDMPPHSIKTPLPEYHTWSEEQYNATQLEFNRTADQLCQVIMSTQCPVFVHCSAGINRSVSILSAAISKLTNRPLDDVLNEIKSQRFNVSPHDAYYLMALEYSPADDEHKSQVRQQIDRDQHTTPSDSALNQSIPWSTVSIPTPEPTQHLSQI